ncbi:MAG: hypothetical protein ABN502_08950, partial [Gammaproteobacteria bacterium]
KKHKQKPKKTALPHPPPPPPSTSPPHIPSPLLLLVLVALLLLLLLPAPLVLLVVPLLLVLLTAMLIAFVLLTALLAAILLVLVSHDCISLCGRSTGDRENPADPRPYRLSPLRLTTRKTLVSAGFTALSARQRIERFRSLYARVAGQRTIRWPSPLGTVS